MNILKKISLGLIAITPIVTTQAQRSITPHDLEKWERITNRTISDDGRWVALTFTPWHGDSHVELHSTDGKQSIMYTPANSPTFSSTTNYLIVKKIPAIALTDSLKLAKAKKMPMDELVIRNLQTDKEWTIDSLVSYRMSQSHDYIAYQRLHKDSALHIATLDGNKVITLSPAIEYAFAKKNATLYFTTKDTLNGKKAGIYLWQSNKPTPTLIKENNKGFLSATLNDTGEKLMFLYCDNSREKERKTSLWLSLNGEPAKEIVTKTTTGIPHGYIISPHYKPWFSEDASRIYMGTAPMPQQKDTTILESNRPNVQVWSWDEEIQYTIQQHNLAYDLKKSYTAVYHIENKKLIQLADSTLPNIQLPSGGMGEWAVIRTPRPYQRPSMWEIRTRNDYYKVSLTTGERTPIIKGDFASHYGISPTGKYVAAYNPTDSCWYTINLQSEKNLITRIATPTSFTAWNEDNDMPDYPSAHGYAGWTENDEKLLIYDRYDIWAFHPEAAEAPINLTKNGRTNKIRYRRIKTDSNEKFIDIKKQSILSGFNESDKTTNFYRSRLATPSAPKQLTEGTFRHANLIKAKKSETYIYTREQFTTFPDVWVCDKNFKKSKQLSHGEEQHKGFLRGTAELVSWTSLDGIALEGILYKPENFAPTKKYPMIVNFYERNSENLYAYRTPEPNRSTIDYNMYLSDGYIIFNPDVRYGGGYPGKSCYNCVIPGIEMIAAQGYIDSKHIGAQGHSWGGYQVAYLATRTNLFAAIESGAPVVNMFSAYGGIRWGSGKSRAYQYEHTQSRLGGTPWSHPERYKESSPLFEMDKVQTPILIMHNDQDGHVPWYQGIEYFIALKRLGKPAWLLNYTGEPHWPIKHSNKMDFQIRMKQFFDHYLKDAPMPAWMRDGIPAVKREFELGY